MTRPRNGDRFRRGPAGAGETNLERHFDGRGAGAQVAFSGFWLKRFAYGPLEWAWRALTYGTLPRLRLAAKQAAPAAP